MTKYVLVALFGVFISSISQVMLKLSAGAPHKSIVFEYLNPLVIGAYGLLFASTLCSVYAFRAIPLSMGPVLDATGYAYVLLYGITIFHEKIDRTKLLAIVIIICGILVYAMGV